MNEPPNLELPTYTRDFLKGMRPEEVSVMIKLSQMGEDGIKDLEGALDFYHASKTVGKFFRWAFISGAGLFFAFMTFSEQIHKAISWFQGVGK